MNKSELITKAAAEAGCSQADMAAALKAITSTIVTTVASGETVETGIGKFERAHRKATTARNPQTGETVPVAAKNVPAFRPGKAFKDTVAGV